MKDLKIHSFSSIFHNQNEVDKYVLETEDLAEKVEDEESAFELYKHIIVLKNSSDHFFVPEIVYSWEEMALSFIESPAALFECVYYEEIVKMHKEHFKEFHILEDYASHNLISIDDFFWAIHKFNIDIRYINKYCKKYHQKLFNYYKCEDNFLQQRYKIWLMEEVL